MCVHAGETWLDLCVWWRVNGRLQSTVIIYFFKHLLGKTIKCCNYWPSVTEGISSLKIKLWVKQLWLSSRQLVSNSELKCMCHSSSSAYSFHSLPSKWRLDETLRLRFRGLWHTSLLGNAEFNIYSFYLDTAMNPNLSICGRKDQKRFLKTFSKSSKWVKLLGCVYVVDLIKQKRE